MRLLTIAALFISTSAFACPNLSGNYPVCRSESGFDDNSFTRVTQSVSNGVTTYVVASSEDELSYVADGNTVIQSESTPEITLSLETTASCDDDTLNVTEAAFVDGERLFKTIKTITKVEKKLNIKMESIIDDQVLYDTVVCE